MSNATGSHLAQIIRAAQADFQTLCAAVAEADRAPAGRWTPREIVSHLLGPGEGALLAMLRRFLDEDVPHIDIVPEQTWMTDERRKAPLAALLEQLAARYEGLAAFAEGLGEEQLGRRAHIPLFKDSPLTDHPSLAAMIGGLGQYHVQMHGDHLREVLAGQAK